MPPRDLFYIIMRPASHLEFETPVLKEVEHESVVQEDLSLSLSVSLCLNVVCCVLCRSGFKLGNYTITTTHWPSLERNGDKERKMTKSWNKWKTLNQGNIQEKTKERERERESERRSPILVCRIVALLPRCHKLFRIELVIMVKFLS